MTSMFVIPSGISAHLRIGIGDADKDVSEEQVRVVTQSLPGPIFDHFHDEFGQFAPDMGRLEARTLQQVNESFVSGRFVTGIHGDRGSQQALLVLVHHFAVRTWKLACATVCRRTFCRLRAPFRRQTCVNVALTQTVCILCTVASFACATVKQQCPCIGT